MAGIIGSGLLPGQRREKAKETEGPATWQGGSMGYLQLELENTCAKHVLNPLRSDTDNECLAVTGPKETGDSGCQVPPGRPKSTLMHPLPPTDE